MASLVVLLFRAVVSVLRADDARPASLVEWERAVRARFPAVPQLSTADLAAWLADTNRVPPVLLDVRPRAEFEVGHLPGAIRVDPDATPAEVRRRVGDEARPVVVYCSVGWRSSALAQRLGKAGFTRVSNLEGSVFAWANEDRPLEADGRPVTRVHPYNRTFGRLLRPEKRAAPDQDRP
jgi:rhodanese-related sulfurtransferase